MAEGVEIHGLVGAKEVGTALRCWGSLAATSDVAIQWAIHDDGSLSETHRSQLETSLTVARWIGRKEADEEMTGLLHKYPHCREFRSRAAYALKLFDGPYFAGDGGYRFVDSDVLFFRKHANLWDVPASQKTMVFLRDDAHAYTARPWHLLGRRGVSFVGGVNVGIIHCGSGAYDLDFLEWFLAKKWDVFWRYPWLEQTCWAAMAARCQCKYFDSSQLKVVGSHEPIPGPLIAGHFTSNVRGRLTEVPMDMPDAERETVRLVSSRKLSPIGLAMAQIKRGVLRRME